MQTLLLWLGNSPWDDIRGDIFENLPSLIPNRMSLGKI